jgi:hypothetical protein
VSSVGVAGEEGSFRRPDLWRRRTTARVKGSARDRKLGVEIWAAEVGDELQRGPLKIRYGESGRWI